MLFEAWAHRAHAGIDGLRGVQLARSRQEILFRNTPQLHHLLAEASVKLRWYREEPLRPDDGGAFCLTDTGGHR